MTITQRNEAIAVARTIIENPHDYAVLDSETTGFGSKAEIVDLAIYSPDGTQLYQSYFKPTCPISPDAVRVHGLTLDILQHRGAITWGDAFEHIISILEGKTILAYNVIFDLGVLRSTSSVHGFNFPDMPYDCIMRLAKKFYGSERFLALKSGDHTATGDVLATIDLIKEIANAPIEIDPDALDVNSDEAAIAAQSKIDELEALIKSLKARVEPLKESVCDYMISQSKDSLDLGDGNTLKVYSSITGLKAKVPLEDLPDSLVETKLSRDAAKKTSNNWTMESEYFEYSLSHYIRKVKTK